MPNSRPNIIFIITDQQRYDTISALGFPYMDTPNLDRLVHEGVNFTNNFVTAASCSPARASLFTGYYPHTTGIYRNADITVPISERCTRIHTKPPWDFMNDSWLKTKTGIWKVDKKGASLLLTHERKNVLRFNMSRPLKALKI